MMRGVRRLGALFLCVAALRSEALPKREYLLNRGYKVSVDRGGNPFYVKMVRKGELQAVGQARRWRREDDRQHRLGEIK